MLIFALTSYPMTSSGVLPSHWSKYHCDSGNSPTLSVWLRMNRIFTLFSTFTILITTQEAYSQTQRECRSNSDGKYHYFSETERLKLREKAKQMFYFGYENYMNFAFPKDELDPIHCTGRGPDYENP